MEGESDMRYQVKVAGRIYEGNDPRILLKRAVEAWRSMPKSNVGSDTSQDSEEAGCDELGLSH
jgi:hypothetical protein